MDINRMKVGLMHIFSLNEKMSKEAKLQIIRFIERANEHQVKVLAMDGELINKSSLDEQSMEIIDDRFDATNIINILNKASFEGMKSLVGRAN